MPKPGDLDYVNLSIPAANEFKAKRRLCPCGSGLDSDWQVDARGIELTRTCLKCHKEKMRSYRPDVLTDPNYWASEQIEED